jgi:hypothetical protein
MEALPSANRHATMGRLDGPAGGENLTKRPDAHEVDLGCRARSDAVVLRAEAKSCAVTVEVRTRSITKVMRRTERWRNSELRDEVCGCLAGALAGLQPEYRDALVVDVGEGSLRDLAEHSGITPGNAAVRLHRARAALRKQVEAACGVCATHGCLECRCGAPSADRRPVVDGGRETLTDRVPVSRMGPPSDA